MSDVPLTRTTLRTAQPIAPQPRSRPLLRAKPLVENIPRESGHRRRYGRGDRGRHGHSSARGRRPDCHPDRHDETGAAGADVGRVAQRGRHHGFPLAVGRARGAGLDRQHAHSHGDAGEHDHGRRSRPHSLQGDATDRHSPQGREDRRGQGGRQRPTDHAG